MDDAGAEPAAEAAAPDAATIVARAERRLAEAERLAARVAPVERTRVWRQLASQLHTLAASPLVAGDPHAQALLRDLLGARNGEELADLFEPVAHYLGTRAEAHARARVARGELDPSALGGLRQALAHSLHPRPPTASANVEPPAEAAPTGEARAPDAAPTAATPPRRRTVLRL